MFSLAAPVLERCQTAETHPFSHRRRCEINSGTRAGTSVPALADLTYCNRHFACFFVTISATPSATLARKQRCRPAYRRQGSDLRPKTCSGQISTQSRRADSSVRRGSTRRGGPSRPHGCRLRRIDSYEVSSAGCRGQSRHELTQRRPRARRRSGRRPIRRANHVSQNLTDSRWSANLVEDVGHLVISLHPYSVCE